MSFMGDLSQFVVIRHDRILEFGIADKPASSSGMFKCTDCDLHCYATVFSQCLMPSTLVRNGSRINVLFALNRIIQNQADGIKGIIVGCICQQIFNSLKSVKYEKNHSFVSISWLYRNDNGTATANQ
jgi:hypothetical protein